jgi:cytochrome c553
MQLTPLNVSEETVKLIRGLSRRLELPPIRVKEAKFNNTTKGDVINSNSQTIYSYAQIDSDFIFIEAKQKGTSDMKIGNEEKHSEVNNTTQLLSLPLSIVQLEQKINMEFDVNSKLETSHTYSIAESCSFSSNMKKIVVGNTISIECILPYLSKSMGVEHKSEIELTVQFQVQAINDADFYNIDVPGKIALISTENQKIYYSFDLGIVVNTITNISGMFSESKIASYTLLNKGERNTIAVKPLQDTLNTVTTKPVLNTQVSKIKEPLYKACTGCHGQYGEKKALGKSGIINTKSEQEIINSLTAYKNGTRNKYGMGGIMKGQTARLSSSDIKRLAKSISQITIQPEESKLEEMFTEWDE